jgi:hypothetical protein
MRKFVLGAWLLIASGPVAVFGADLNLTGSASGGGTTELRGSASGSGQLTLDGHSSRGGTTVMSGRAEGSSRLMMQGDSRGRGARAESIGHVVGRSQGFVDARSVNQAYGGVSRSEVYGEAAQGGYARLDQLNTVRAGRGESVMRGVANGGVVDLVGTMAILRGVGKSEQFGRSYGAGASTRQELLVDAMDGRASGTMRSESTAGDGIAHSEVLGVVRGGSQGSVYSESFQRTEGARAKTIVEGSFFTN